MSRSLATVRSLAEGMSGQCGDVSVVSKGDFCAWQLLMLLSGSWKLYIPPLLCMHGMDVTGLCACILLTQTSYYYLVSNYFYPLALLQGVWYVDPVSSSRVGSESSSGPSM